MDYICETLQDDSRFPPSPSCLSDPDQTPQDLFAEWVKFPIRNKESSEASEDSLSEESSSSDEGWLTRYIIPDSMVLMDDYLMILTQDEFDRKSKKEKIEAATIYARLLAVDLRDFSVQQIKIHERDEKGYCFWRSGYTLQKYNENQIIAFGGGSPEMIIIESFKPLSVKWQRMGIEEKTGFSNDVQMYKGCFYTVYRDYEPRGFFSRAYREQEELRKGLWRFEMESQTWKACKTVGECPGPREQRKSFVFKDHLYFYEGVHYSENCEKDIFMLNFDTMEWKKFEQQEDHSNEKSCLNGDIYKEHLVLLCKIKGYDQQNSNHTENTQLRCWNLHTNSWKIFNVKGTGLHEPLDRLIVYKNLLLTVGEFERKICLATFNVDNLGLESPISPEEQPLKALFMNEKGSDVKLKVQDQIIPAHKQVLVKKSPFYACLFESGMAETKQDVIEIKDCEFVVFREYLRWIYCRKIELNDEVLAFKLIEFADRLVQDDLKERCLYYLHTNINPKTVFPILEGANAGNLQDLITWCCNYLRKNIKLINITEMVEFFISKQNEYLLRGARYFVLDWVMRNYFEIYQERNQSLRLCEELLVKNIEIETFLEISRFLIGEDFQRSHKDWIWKREYLARRQEKSENALGLCSLRRDDDELKKEEREAKEVFEEETMKLRNAMYCFLQENFEQINQEESIVDKLPNSFIMDAIAYMFPNLSTNTSLPMPEDQEIRGKDGEKNIEKGQARGRKRREPIDEEGKPELKKTKKCEHCRK